MDKFLFMSHGNYRYRVCVFCRQDFQDDVSAGFIEWLHALQGGGCSNAEPVDTRIEVGCTNRR